MTTARNTEWMEAFFTRAYPNLAGNTINQGDLVYEDSITYDVKSCTTDALAARCVGMATQTYPVLSELSGDPSNLKIVVRRKGRVSFLATNGLTFQPSEKVYVGADAQTVTNVNSNNYWIGYVANTDDGKQESLVGTGSNKILVDLDPRWPDGVDARAHTEAI
jgi:hypothetical protein